MYDCINCVTWFDEEPVLHLFSVTSQSARRKNCERTPSAVYLYCTPSIPAVLLMTDESLVFLLLCANEPADINCELYPIKEGQRLTFVLASTLDLSGKPDDGTYKPLGDEVRYRKKYAWHFTAMALFWNSV